MDTKKGHVTLSTSMANKEKAGYKVQVNGASGQFTIIDNLGNTVQIDSVSGAITCKNQAGSFVAINKRLINIFAGDTITVANSAGTQAVLNAGTASITAPDSVTIKSPKITLDGDVTCTGKLSITGDTTMAGNVSGKESSFTKVTTPNLQAANHPN